MFNGFSIFGTGNKSVQVGCIILDDSHACIDSMLSSCTIQILKESPAFAQIIALFEEQLRDQGSGTFQDLLNDRANTLMPIPYWSWQSKIEELTKIVSQNVDDLHIKFAWPILRDHLSDCQALVSNSKIEISPLCMPIQQYGIFSSAKHRILMSATTQEDTFFIKGLDLSIPRSDLASCVLCSDCSLAMCSFSTVKKSCIFPLLYSSSRKKCLVVLYAYPFYTRI